MSDWGIASLDLTSDGVVRTPTQGVTEAGHTSAQATDGSEILVGDVGFEYSTIDYTILNETFSLLSDDISIDLANIATLDRYVDKIELEGSGSNSLKLTLEDLLNA